MLEDSEQKQVTKGLSSRLTFRTGISESREQRDLAALSQTSGSAEKITRCLPCQYNKHKMV